MIDTVDKKTRSRIMASIRSYDTKPEIITRKGLHRKGIRYRLHDKKLPGKPDMVFRKYNAILFVHGCFWHGHDDCKLFRMPRSRTEWWENKIQRNRTRDDKVNEELRDMGWRLAHIWECALQGRDEKELEKAINKIAKWLDSNRKNLEIRGPGRG